MKKPKQQVKDHCSPLVVMPTGTDAKSVQDARSAGYCVVLCDDPSRVKVILAGSEVSGGDLLMSAMLAVCTPVSDDGRDHFAKELWRRMKAREAKCAEIDLAT